MKINKIFLMAGIAMLSFAATSCSDDDGYKKGEQQGEYNVTFANEENKTLQITETDFTITVQRANGSGELTLPLNVIEAPEVFENVPTSVTFANGETSKDFTISLSADAEPFVDYVLRIAIPNEYAALYTPQTDAPALNITVHREDYKPFADIVYHSGYFKANIPAVLEYSEIKGLYRASGLFFDGYDFYFDIDMSEEAINSDEGNLKVVDADGNTRARTPIGYDHPTYGAMYLYWASSNWTGYDPDDDAFYLPAGYHVVVNGGWGSFGTFWDYFYITKLYGAAQ